MRSQSPGATRLRTFDSQTVRGTSSMLRSGVGGLSGWAGSGSRSVIAGPPSGFGCGGSLLRVALLEQDKRRRGLAGTVGDDHGSAFRPEQPALEGLGDAQHVGAGERLAGAEQ